MRSDPTLLIPMIISFGRPSRLSRSAITFARFARRSLEAVSSRWKSSTTKVSSPDSKLIPSITGTSFGSRGVKIFGVFSGNISASIFFTVVVLPVPDWPSTTTGLPLRRTSTSSAVKFGGFTKVYSGTPSVTKTSSKYAISTLNNSFGSSRAISDSRPAHAVAALLNFLLYSCHPLQCHYCSPWMSINVGQIPTG